MDTTTADAEGMISEGEAFATWAPNVKVALGARRARAQGRRAHQRTER